MTYLEQKRAQAQKLYQEEQEYWAKNADEIKRQVPFKVILRSYGRADDLLVYRLMEEDRQKQMAEMKGSLMGMLPFSSGGASGQAPGQAAPAGQ